MYRCYRHPDRETGIQCTRCDRGICPDCMISASVGFQCPECVSAKQNPTVRNRFGGTAISVPRVSKFIITLCLAIFVIQLFTANRLLSAETFGMWPAGIAQGDWYRLLTSAFLHGGFMHIAFNMYALYIMGPQLEELVGHRRFASLYVLAALGGSVASYWFSPINTLSVGASGAIFGLMTATILIGRDMRADISQIAVLFGLNVVIGFLNPGVDWRAHLGGAVVGGAVAWLLIQARRTGKQTIVTFGFIAISIGLVAAVVLRSSAINALFGL